MKLKERGLSTGAIVGIVVAVVVVAVVVPLVVVLALGIGGGGPGGLPVYTGATGYDLPPGAQEMLPQGVQVKAYTTSASVSAVITWYKGQMPQEWTFDNTHSSESYGLLVYQKGNDGAMVFAMDGSFYGVSGTIIVLATGPYQTIITGT